MSELLTSLQRGVVQRLRNAGHMALAAEAEDAWSRGACLVAYQIGQCVGDQSLPADFALANSSAQRALPR